MEGARLATLVRSALEAAGARQPDRHFLVYQAGSVATFLISPAPIEETSVDNADAIATSRGFVRHWPAPGTGVESSLIQRVLSGRIDDLERAGADLSPPTDDRPFFFHTLSLFHSATGADLQRLGPNEQAVSLLRTLLAVLGGVGGALFVLPFVIRGRLPRGPALARSSLYFFAIGIAFMFVEIPWMQRFVLYLGHPSYATTVVLSALLVGAGVGAMMSPKLLPSARVLVAFVLPAAVLLLNAMMGPVPGRNPGLVAELARGDRRRNGGSRGRAHGRTISDRDDARHRRRYACRGAAGVVLGDERHGRRPRNRAVARVSDDPRLRRHSRPWCGGVRARGVCARPQVSGRFYRSRLCDSRSIVSALLLAAAVVPARAQMTALERQRLAAHLEMTASWLNDELKELTRSQLEFRRAPGTWSLLEVLDHLVVVGDIYWEDLQKGVATPLTGRNLSRDEDILWYGIDRTNREIALASEDPRGRVRDLASRSRCLPHAACPAAAIRQDDEGRPAESLRRTATLRCVSVGAAHLDARAAAHPPDSRSQGRSEVPENIGAAAGFAATTMNQRSDPATVSVTEKPAAFNSRLTLSALTPCIPSLPRSAG